MDMKELAGLVGWSEEQVRKALDNACVKADGRPSETYRSYFDESLLEWLAELVAEVDNRPEKRSVIHHMAEIYFYTQTDVAAARVAAEGVDAAIEPFSALDLIRIGCIIDASRAALRTLDIGAAAYLLRMEIGNPFYEKGKPRHMLGHIIQMRLDGMLGPRVATRTKEHLELCRGCAENYQYHQEHPKEGDDENSE